MINVLRISGYLSFITSILFLSTLTGCDTGTGIEGAIIDNPDNEHKLRELLFIIRLDDQNGNSILLNRLDSVVINLNGQRWGVFASDSLNLQGVKGRIEGDFLVTDQEISYLVTAGYQLRADTFATAGEYSSYLNRRIDLEPGDYIAEIAEIHFRDINGNPALLSPRIYRQFTIDENIASLYLGSYTAIVY